jgi:hypothetical protein
MIFSRQPKAISMSSSSPEPLQRLYPSLRHETKPGRDQWSYTYIGVRFAIPITTTRRKLENVFMDPSTRTPNQDCPRYSCVHQVILILGNCSGSSPRFLISSSRCPSLSSIALLSDQLLLFHQTYRQSRCLQFCLIEPIIA